MGSQDRDQTHQEGRDLNLLLAQSLNLSLLPDHALPQRAVHNPQLLRMRPRQMEMIIETLGKIQWKQRKMVMIGDQAVKVVIKNFLVTPFGSMAHVYYVFRNG